MKLTINIMNLDNNGRDLAKVNNNTKTILCAKFGGYSAVPCEGGWLSDGGVLYKDKGELVTVFTDDNKDNLKQFKLIAWSYKVAAEQESVLISVNDKPVFM